MQVEGFGDRVRRLREGKGLKQSDLAASADLDPAALSRILAGERSPRMEHLIAIARGLSVTVSDLVGGTDAESMLSEWVTREQFTACETARLEALAALEIARADLKARLSEIEALRTSSSLQLGRIETLERDIGRLRGEAEDAKRLRPELLDLRRRHVEMESEGKRLTAQVDAYGQTLVAANNRLQQYMRAYEEARSRSVVIQRDLAAAKDGQVGALALGALVGGLFGAVVMNSPSTPSRTSAKGARRG
jgi:transcriptional regulator with XRE-family HTH domain